MALQHASAGRGDTRWADGRLASAYDQRVDTPPDAAPVNAEQALHGLYRLDPREFVAARDELVRRLRGDGQRGAAAEVRGARRPTLAAWAVNQLPAQGVRALLDAGAALRRAQQRALSGVRAAELRGAADRRREAVDALTEEAARLLRGAGHAAQPHLDAVRQTLLAASTDVEVGKQVVRGRLAKEVPAPSGFGDVTGFETVADDDGPPQEREVAEAREAVEAPQAAEAREREVAEAREAVEAIRRQLRDAESEVAQLGREAD